MGVKKAKILFFLLPILVFSSICLRYSLLPRRNFIISPVYCQEQLPLNPSAKEIDDPDFSGAHDYFLTDYLLKQIDKVIANYEARLEFNGLAIQCAILTSAYKLYNNEEYKRKARDIGDYLIEYMDLDKDGKAGWGLSPGFSGNNCKGLGSWDAFSDGVCNPRNTAYMFQTGRVVRSLAGLYQITGDQKYLQAAQKAVEDSWDLGTASVSDCKDCFYYWYSYSGNDKNRYVRNTNIEMADALMYLFYVSGIEKYKERALACLRSEIKEIESGNKGYFGRNDPGYLKNPVFESTRTEDHYPSQAFHIYEISRILKTHEYDKYIIKIMRDWQTCDNDYCRKGRCSYWSGDFNKCSNSISLSYCFLREVSQEMRQKCLIQLSKIKKLNWYQAWAVANNFYELDEESGRFIKNKLE